MASVQNMHLFPWFSRVPEVPGGCGEIYEHAVGNCWVRRASAAAVAEANTRVWDEFGETMKKDFWLASRKFWQIVRRRACLGILLSGGENILKNSGT